jgi:glycosyltransferase involved in cell wall biosynthesis
LKILRVIPRYAPAWRYGGSVRFSYDLDSVLSRRGCAITVYTSDQLDEHRRSPQASDRLGEIAVRRFSNPVNYLASQAPWLGLYPVGLRDALRGDAGNFDVVHVTEARGAHVRWAFQAARRGGVPVLWSPLGALAAGVGIRRPYRRLYDAVHDTRGLVRQARVMIAQSTHEAAVFAELGAQPTQIRTIGLGVDGRWFTELPARGQFRHAIGIEPHDPMVLFIGRLHPTKGLDVLVKAAAIARRRHPRLQVVLIGWDHGALRTVTRVARSVGLQDAVRVLPPVFDIARVQAYVDADVFAAAATIFEETSLAAMEAIASGTPCVLTHQCEVPDLEASGAGVVTACTPEAFAAGLLAVLADPHRRMRAAAARRALLSSQTLNERVDAYLDVLHDITGLRPRAGRPTLAIVR